MGLLIEDGKGSGKTAGVTSDHRLTVESVTSSIEHFINHNNGRSFNLVFNQSPTAADDCIAYIMNNDEKDLIVEGMTVGATDITADDSIYFKVGCSGTRNGATAVIPANMNAGSGKSAVGDFEHGADLDGGTATLAGGNEFNRFVFAGVTDFTSKYINFEQDLILPKNRSMTIWIGGSATGTFYITAHFNYHNLEG